MFRKATAALGCAAMLALLCVTDQAVAQPQPAQDGDEAEVEAASDDEGYMKRYPPQAGTLELGVYFGAVFPSSNHSFSSTERDETELQDINNGLDVGLRLALYPLEFLGVEGELGYAPLSTEDDESAAWIMYRAHVLGQLPGSSITPFFVLGTGFISSRSDSLGNDTDQAYHFGLGVKAAMSRRSVIRLDVRDNISNKRSGESFPHNLEVLLGVSFVFGAKEPPPPPTDMDGDGFMDNEDDCPDEAGIAPDGCPPEDTDGDGITDDADACPEEAGIAPDGCPDKDAVLVGI
ncbi:MAG: thrombospondin type 3 repeat-containing protein, partial [Myxococcota bacterium]